MYKKIQTIRRQVAELVREEPYEVYMPRDGRLAALHGDEWIVKNSMKALDKAMTSERKSVKVFVVNEYSDKVSVYEIVEFLNGGKILTKDGKKPYVGSSVYLYDEKLIKEFQEYLTEYRKVMKEFTNRRIKLVHKARNLYSSTDLKEYLK
jgi:predicted transcriptional regulator